MSKVDLLDINEDVVISTDLFRRIMENKFITVMHAGLGYENPFIKLKVLQRRYISNKKSFILLCEESKYRPRHNFTFCILILKYGITDFPHLIEYHHDTMKHAIRIFQHYAKMLRAKKR